MSSCSQEAGADRRTYVHRLPSSSCVCGGGCECGCMCGCVSVGLGVGVGGWVVLNVDL